MAEDRRTPEEKAAVGALSHLIGAFWIIAAVECDCEPKRNQDLRQILLHIIGIYWLIMKMRYGINNPKREMRNAQTN